MRAATILTILCGTLISFPSLAGAERDFQTQLYVHRVEEGRASIYSESPQEETESGNHWADRAVFPFRGFGGSLVEELGRDLVVNGDVWGRTLTTPLDPRRREETYKVFTHLMDFSGENPITKGAGGKYSHHRGLFIGWKDTMVEGEDFDTWHMSNCAQRHERWWIPPFAKEPVLKLEDIAWCDDQGKPFIHETRVITPHEGPKGVRLFDFESELVSLAGTIPLRGDLQHAGMQVRLANEVSEHPETTEYLLPEEAVRHDDDKVTGAWWACCSAVVNGHRYWVVHMTPPTHPTGIPVYSIRPYARFGAFFEPDLEEGRPLSLNFRIALSKDELTLSDCEHLYTAYAEEISGRGNRWNEGPLP